MKTAFVAAVLLAATLCSGAAADVAVSNATEFRAAVAAAKPGTRVLLAPGAYGGGFHFEGIRGEAEQPIVIAAANPKEPPVFSGRQVGLHFSKPSHLELQDLIFEKISGNGLNIDDGGTTGAAHHVILRGLRVRDIGSRGNEDAIKLSGVDDFDVLNCTVERWGTGGGSGIDMVGCHRGLIRGNTFRHQDPPNANAVQCKGGSSEIRIEGNIFDKPVGRGVNIGGSTGEQFFRPPLREESGNAEARKIVVEGNRFIGSWSPVAFVGSEGGIVRFNTFERPLKWTVRILQENQGKKFVPAAKGEFTDNVIIFEAARCIEGGVNVGGGTAPETFKFARNWWYAVDRPDRSHPKLPVKGEGGVYGKDPALANEKAGADAWKHGE